MTLAGKEIIAWLERLGEFAQERLEAQREHHLTVGAALAFPDVDDPAVEIEVLPS